MKMYDPDGACPKCHWADVSTIYQEPWDWARALNQRPEGEHFLRVCQRCHYDWREAIPRKGNAMLMERGV